MNNSYSSTTSYDLSRWEAKVIDHEEKGTPDRSWDQDGIHRIFTKAGVSIDMFLQDYQLLDRLDEAEERVILVGFTGALTIRNGKPGPFFSGLKVAKQLQLPLLAIADPTISKCNEVIISWYAGNDSIPNASEIIGNWLDKLALHYNARLVFFGGSAGGFGALSSLSHMTTPVDCLVWNPQTSISRYTPKFVLHYLKNGFSDHFSKLNVSQSVTRDEMTNFLNETGVRHDLQSNYRLPKNANLMFVQNKSDWHVTSHALPFLQNLGIFAEADNLQHQIKDNISVFFGNFGRGHIAPQKHIVMACLKNLIDSRRNPLNTSVFEKSLIIKTDVSKSSITSTAEPPQDGKPPADEDGFEVRAILEGKNVIARIDVMPGSFIKPTFAFYFIRNGIREKIRAYSTDNTASFELVDEPRSLYVMGFIFENGSRKFKKVRVQSIADASADPESVLQEPIVITTENETFTELMRESREEFLARNSPLLLEKFKSLGKDWRDGNTGYMTLPYAKNSITFNADEKFNWGSCPQLPPQRMWFYSLRFIGRLLATGEKYSDERAYTHAIKLMADFLEFCSDSENVSFISRINSGDHSTAERVKVMIFLWQFIVAKEIKTTDEFNQRLLSEIERWTNWLANDRNYKANNHGLMACMSLLYVYLFLGEKNGRRYFEIARERLTRLMDHSFDSAGLCNENSIGYHNFNLSLYRSILSWSTNHKLDQSFVEKLQDTVTRATSALALCVFPNGDIPPIGDSSIYKSGISSINNSHCFAESGFAVIKSEHFYLSVSCGSPSEIHKQMDDSSIHLRYKGADLIVDPGAYLYDRVDRFRKCIGSSKGHSGIYLKRFDDLSRRQVRAKYGEICGSISKFEEFSGGVQLACSYRAEKESFSIHRYICVIWDQEVVIVDKAEGADDAVQRFLFGSSVDVKRQGGHFRLNVGSNEYSFFHNAARCDLYTAEDNESNVRGWHSVNYGELLPTTGIDLSNPKKNYFSTILSLRGASKKYSCSAKSKAFAKMADKFFR